MKKDKKGHFMYRHQVPPGTLQMDRHQGTYPDRGEKLCRKSESGRSSSAARRMDVDAPIDLRQICVKAEPVWKAQPKASYYPSNLFAQGTFKTQALHVLLSNHISGNLSCSGNCRRYSKQVQRSCSCKQKIFFKWSCFCYSSNVLF